MTLSPPTGPSGLVCLFVWMEVPEGENLIQLQRISFGKGYY